MIDQDYKLAVLDEVLCNVEYQPDGSSGTMWKQYLKNPKGFAFWRKVCMRYPQTSKRLLVDCIHYCSSSILAGERHFVREAPHKFLTLLCVLAGLLLSVITKRKANV